MRKKTTDNEVHAFAHSSWNDGRPSWHSGKEPTCQCRRHKRCRFDPWVLTIPWRRKWQPASVFLPGKFQGQRSLEGYNGATKSQTQLSTHTHTHTHIGTVSCQISISGWPCLFIAWKVCTAFEMQAGYSFHYLLQKELCDNRTLTFFSKLFSHSTLPLFVLLKLEILHLPDEPRVYSATPRTIQSMKFSRQEYWSG